MRTISPADVAALKAPEVLHAYCRAALGAGKQKGRLTFYPCPFGTHSRLKLEVTERDGVGVALCRACNTGGTVFDVAAGVLGLDVKRDFASVVRGVADTVGYILRDDGTETPRKGSRKRKAGFSRPVGVSAPPAPARTADKPLEYLPPEMERAALDAVRRAADNPTRMATYAALLGIPFDCLMYHTRTEDAAALGLLGLDERGRLLYVYTHRPAPGEPVRVHLVKFRCKEIPWRPGDDRSFHIPRGCSKDKLWGMDALTAAGVVVITEGESDALAVRAAFWAWLDDWAHNAPETYPYDAMPAVVCKPDASTFKESWAHRLRGKDVILVADSDVAGRTGAESTARILHAAGVRRVFIWTPTGVKDARAALDATEPWLLAEDIVENKKKVKQ